MFRAYYRFLGDEVKSPSNVVEGLDWFLVDTVPRKGEFVAVSGMNVHKVTAIVWFTDRERHSKARVPVLVLDPEPL